MDICEDCGRLFLPATGQLLFVHLEDRWGVWHQWLCRECVEDVEDDVAHGRYSMESITLFGFDLPEERRGIA